MTLKTAIFRAQCMSNQDGKTRWVKRTSLGWRIELTPSPVNPGLCFQINPENQAA